MTTTTDTLQGKWKELKGEIRKKWGEITDDEITKTKGNFESLLGLVQQRYGIAKEKAREELTSLMKGLEGKFSDHTNRTIDQTKDKVDRSIDKKEDMV